MARNAKRCKDCGEVKAFERFRIDRSISDGRGNRCKDCTNRRARERYVLDADWQERERERSRLKARRRREEDEATCNPWLGLQAARAAGAPIIDREISRIVVLERDDGVCGICGEDVDPCDFEVDHIEPLADGGEHSYANVQVAHMECNRRKSMERQQDLGMCLRG